VVRRAGIAERIECEKIRPDTGETTSGHPDGRPVGLGWRDADGEDSLSRRFVGLPEKPWRCGAKNYDKRTGKPAPSSPDSAPEPGVSRCARTFRLSVFQHFSSTPPAKIEFLAGISNVSKLVYRNHPERMTRSIPTPSMLIKSAGPTRFAALMAILILAAAPCAGQEKRGEWISLDPDRPAGSPAEAVVLSSTAERTKLRISVPGIWLSSASYGEETFSTVDFPEVRLGGAGTRPEQEKQQ
jgi:hypothetical protein